MHRVVSAIMLIFPDDSCTPHRLQLDQITMPILKSSNHEDPFSDGTWDALPANQPSVPQEPLSRLTKKDKPSGAPLAEGVGGDWCILNSSALTNCALFREMVTLRFSINQPLW